MAEAHCTVDQCVEPATTSLPLTRKGVRHTLDVSVDHAHDIDWGVIAEEELAEQIEGKFGSQGVA
ncbi:hypothetical protein B7R22_15980 [Subtercola boreus]|uniref:Uncharacterized protein n=1 Tax=Subtercola boreus TaxID=120213 RepID=A0A3E0VQP3_9MICO|nr:hypothetical protein [Subtercola boreus]RFA12304.1 hypothetical protein B7R22_15980 [Subtercola boreus]